MNKIAPAHPLHIREKMLAQGSHSLSDTELLAVFIGSGTKKRSCVQLATDLMCQFGNVRAILNAELKTFNQIPGLGPVRYLQLQALREICRRSDFIQLQKDIQLTNPQATYTYLKRQLRDKKHETFVGIFLDSQHRILSYEELFKGTINAASVYSRPIIERTLQLNAAALILAHNHPSGLSDASTADKTLTAHLDKALSLVDVRLLDHVVIGDNEVYSILSDTKWHCH